MQPDPRVFLPAIRRELLRSDLFTDALQTGLSPILMMRASEGLAQLALRQRSLPALLRGLRSRQHALLERAAAQLDAARLARPASVTAALDGPATPGEPGEEDVRLYELHVDALSAAIAALAAQRTGDQRIGGALDQLCQSASAIECDMRAAYRAALETLREELERGRAVTATPTVEVSDALLTSILRERFPQYRALAASQVRRLPGINAQEVYFFDLAHHPECTGPMVLRRAPGWSATKASLADEAELLTDLHGLGLPVAPVLMAEREGSRLGGSCIIMQRLPGKAQTPESLGTSGRSIALEMARLLARIHQVDPRRLRGIHRDDGQPMHRRMEMLLERSYARWQSERIEGSMALEAAFAWMRANTGCLDERVSLVHGDCNFRNVLLDGGRISAMLDWELSHPGHAAEDLTYIRPDIERLMPWDEFQAAYAAAGGQAASPEVLRYFEVWKDVWRTSMAAGVYGSYIRGEHQDFLFGTVAFNEYYATLDTLAEFMSKAAFRSR